MRARRCASNSRRTTDSRAVVLFWVRDQETAEEIVRLLPTTRTVELNHDAAGVAHARVESIGAH